MEIHRRAARPGAERDILAAAPTCDETMLLCIRTWHDLGSCRPLGFGGLGSIPLTAILDLARFKRWSRRRTEMLIAVIRKLDADRAEREASRAALT